MHCADTLNSGMSFYEVATDYRSFGASETYFGQRWSDGGKATANFDRVDEGFEGFLDDGKAFGAHLFISRANLVKPWKFCLTPLRYFVRIDRRGL